MGSSPHKSQGLGGHQVHVLNGPPLPKVVENELAHLRAGGSRRRQEQAGCPKSRAQPASASCGGCGSRRPCTQPRRLPARWAACRRRHSGHTASCTLARTNLRLRQAGEWRTLGTCQGTSGKRRQHAPCMAGVQQRQQWSTAVAPYSRPHPARTLLAAVPGRGGALAPKDVVGVVGAVPLLVRGGGHAVQVGAVGAVVAAGGSTATPAGSSGHMHAGGRHVQRQHACAAIAQAPTRRAALRHTTAAQPPSQHPPDAARKVEAAVGGARGRAARPPAVDLGEAAVLRCLLLARLVPRPPVLLQHTTCGSRTARAARRAGCWAAGAPRGMAAGQRPTRPADTARGGERRLGRLPHLSRC